MDPNGSFRFLQIFPEFLAAFRLKDFQSCSKQAVDGNPFKNIPVLPQKVVLFPATNIIHSFGLNFYVNGQDILGICTISSCFSWKFFGILLTSIVSIFPKITNIDTKSTYAPCRGINLFKYLMHFFKYFQIFRNLPGFYFE